MHPAGWSDTRPPCDRAVGGWVIDSKHYRGRLEPQRPRLGHREALYVGRSCSPELLASTSRQRARGRSPTGTDVPVHAGAVLHPAESLKSSPERPLRPRRRPRRLAYEDALAKRLTSSCGRWALSPNLATSSPRCWPTAPWLRVLRLETDRRPGGSDAGPPEIRSTRVTRRADRRPGARDVGT